jgi:hypothetical protein
MSARASLRHRPWLSDLPTARVSIFLCITHKDSTDMLILDANGFKEAFIKAQQENEALFGKSEQ